MLKFLEFMQLDFLRLRQKIVPFTLFELTPPRFHLYFVNVSLIYVLFLGW